MARLINNNCASAHEIGWRMLGMTIERTDASALDQASDDLSDPMPVAGGRMLRRPP
jgi:hypothetical protein